MGYLHIDNLYKNQDILQYKECYALEKIHGTSAHISLWRQQQMVFGPSMTEEEFKEKYPDEIKIEFFSGGEKHERFVALFNAEWLKEKFKELNIPKITIYGEAHGGKQQGMSATYGPDLKFVVFDVKIGSKWLAVPQAEDIAKQLNLEFVWYNKILCSISAIESVRDTHSIQAIRNGMGEGKMREGIVLRPLIEVIKNNDHRIIAKHKNDAFKETKTKRTVDLEAKMITCAEANKVAEEWVTPMRLSHVLDKIENPSIEKMRNIIFAMTEDIKREGEKEIVWSKPIEKSIGRATAIMAKKYFINKLKG